MVPGLKKGFRFRLGIRVTIELKRILVFFGAMKNQLLVLAASLLNIVLQQMGALVNYVQAAQLRGNRKRVIRRFRARSTALRWMK